MFPMTKFIGGRNLWTHQIRSISFQFFVRFLNKNVQIISLESGEVSAYPVLDNSKIDYVS